LEKFVGVAGFEGPRPKTAADSRDQHLFCGTVISDLPLDET
jgi:hypothetical protein